MDGDPKPMQAYAEQVRALVREQSPYISCVMHASSHLEQSAAADFGGLG